LIDDGKITTKLDVTDVADGDTGSQYDVVGWFTGDVLKFQRHNPFGWFIALEECFAPASKRYKHVVWIKELE